MKHTISYMVAFAVLTMVFSASAKLVMLPTTGGGSGTAWNPSDKSAQVMLSGGNTIASVNSSASTFAGVRGITSYAVGTNHKVVLTMTYTTDILTSGVVAGLDDGAGSLDGINAYPGASSAHSWGTQDQTGDYQDQLGPVGTTCSSHTVPGSVVWLAIDFNSGKLWCSTDCATWYGTTPNPDTGTGAPYTLSSATYKPMGGLSDQFSVNEQITINTAPSLGGCTNISTFTTWN